LIGVKEVPVENILSDKTYLMFSHTMKEQPYNRGLLKKILEKGSSLIHYEAFTNEKGARVIAFGKFAGMVGAHNALYAYGERTEKFHLPRMHSLDDYSEVQAVYKKTKFSTMKIVLTGTGRVSVGASLVLDDMGIQKVSPLSFVKDDFDYPVYTQLNSFFYTKRKDGKTFDSAIDFYQNPTDYESDFSHFLSVSDIFINGIFWDPKAPAFFTKEQMKNENFNIKVIADITCDIAPESSIPSTLKASTILEPVFGYNPKEENICAPYQKNSVDMMTIDNLPNELPKDASTAFGEMFTEYVLKELVKKESEFIEKAKIVDKGKLGKHYQYLQEFIK
jgi:hypothetical protein